MIRIIIGIILIIIFIGVILDVKGDPEILSTILGGSVIMLLPGILLIYFGFRSRKKHQQMNKPDKQTVKAELPKSKLPEQPVTVEAVNEDTISTELVQFLTAFGRNLTRLIAGLEAGERSTVNMALEAMTAQDLGAKLMIVFSLKGFGSLERLADPLKAIEADLTRAEAFVSKPGLPPALYMFVPSKLMVVKSVLGHLQKTGLAEPTSGAT
jgi:hypothetical protein